MRYSVDVAGVTEVASRVAAACEDVPGLVSDVIQAVNDAASQLLTHEAEVSTALEAVFAARRQSGPGISMRIVQLLDTLQLATTDYVIADGDMTATTSIPGYPARHHGRTLSHPSARPSPSGWNSTASWRTTIRS